MQIRFQNPEATAPLIVPVLVLPNTPEEIVDGNIRANSALDLPWLYAADANDAKVAICGGGPSLADFEDQLETIQHIEGWTIIGLNGAAKWLCDRGIRCDYQIILDAKQETSGLVERRAGRCLISSQVHPDTVRAAIDPMLFHLNNKGIEDLMPEDRVAGGGYSLVGGGVSVGITALTVAYTLGFRDFHLFGYDSSNRDQSTHAYDQRMNALIPNIEVTWGGKTYTSSMPMKVQAEAFPSFARELQASGCNVEVYGDGLLPAMWSTPPATEREKYQWFWSLKSYRTLAPGEHHAAKFIEVAQPDGPVIDFGCGTGRGAKAVHDMTGQDVILIDFTDNCRDRDVMHFPFIQWDLTEPLPVSAPYGYCTDVMEHIPTSDVPRVIDNIMSASGRVFFSICTRPDNMGGMYGQTLHMTVRDHAWWADCFSAYRIEWQEECAETSAFYVLR